MKKTSTFFFFLLCFAFKGCFMNKTMTTETNDQSLKPIVIAIVGDSTVADYAEEDKLRGWGQMIPEFFTANVTVINYAKCGESSKSFIKKGFWDEALANRADYFMIQFGHNDCPGKGDRATDPNTDYKDYILKYIDDSRKSGAQPILVTPMERRNFEQDGTVKLTLDKYSDAMKKVGKITNVPVIDLHERSVRFYEFLGEEGSNYLNTEADRTHFISHSPESSSQSQTTQTKQY